MNRTILLLTLTLSAPALIAAGPPQAQTGASEEKIVARVNGDVITLAELERLYGALSPEMRANYERAGGKLQFLDYLVRRRLLLQEAGKSGFDKKPYVARELSEVRDDALFNLYVRDVVAEQVVTEAEMRKYYEEKKSEFTIPEMVKARHIVITPLPGNVVNTTKSDAKSRKEALDLITGIAQQVQVNPASFSDLAMKFSEDGAAPSGGDLGWFERGRMIREFDDVVFAMEPGKISHVVETEFGYHVIKLEEKKKAGLLPYESVRGQIRARLLQAKMDQVMAETNRLANELRSSSNVTIHRENL